MSYAENIIKILAGLPEFLRKPMLKHRLDEFFGMSNEDKREIINNVLEAIPEVEPSTLGRLIKTWIEVLKDFDKSKREEIFALYASLLASKPDTIPRLDIQGLISIFNQFDDDTKKDILDSIKSALEKIDSKGELLLHIPNDAKSILQLY